jgi:hypothetical protein
MCGGRGKLCYSTRRGFTAFDGVEPDADTRDGASDIADAGHQRADGVLVEVSVQQFSDAVPELGIRDVGPW